MYFSRERCLEILRSVLPLLAHQDSRLWFDYVSSDLIAGTTRIAHATTFLDAMQKMGEPFIHGFHEIADEVNALGFCLCDDIGSGQIVESPDQIYDLYRFCVVSLSRLNDIASLRGDAVLFRTDTICRGQQDSSRLWMDKRARLLELRNCGRLR